MGLHPRLCKLVFVLRCCFSCYRIERLFLLLQRNNFLTCDCDCVHTSILFAHRSWPSHGLPWSRVRKHRSLVFHPSTQNFTRTVTPSPTSVDPLHSRVTTSIGTSWDVNSWCSWLSSSLTSAVSHSIRR